MPRLQTGEFSLHYEISGEGNRQDIVLISGIGTQLTWWSESFVAALTDRGFRVIRADNRDVGHSDGYDHLGIPNIQSMISDRIAGRPLHPPYRLEDMASDICALIGGLGIERAHIVGGSMGGMIAQLFALNHPEKVASLVSIMSTTGNPALPAATPAAQAVLLRARPSPQADREAYLQAAVESALVLGSPAYPEDTGKLRANAEATLDRAYRPAGFARHYAAIISSTDRRDRLQGLNLPVAVIHGGEDPLVRPEAGRDTAANIPGAEYVEFEGMGHNIPTALEGEIADVIARTAARA
ncbi:alpha/beta hydrolase [Mesorhizobium sp. CAU 1732]|uniref:alpha/beta fold hydrolase n=1 Tax=Mesorhizobium sp. CAU 1732 TaxID=3140358 RepID=UPI0032607734